MPATIPKLSECTLYQPSFEHDACGFGLMADMGCHTSHSMLEQAIAALTSMKHRGAVASDGVSGDGAGLLFDLPQEFMRTCAQDLGVRLTGDFGIGQLYLSRDDSKRKHAQAIVEKVARRFAIRIVLWRQIPIHPEILGVSARDSLPVMMQAFCTNEPCTDSPEPLIHHWDFEHRLFLTRKLIEHELCKNDPDFCIASMSSKMIAYKGLINSNDLAKFYPDLEDPRLAVRLVVFHQRFSTNTEPSWSLVQPFHYLAHNGEINTISGNRRWAYARRMKLLKNPRLSPLLDLDHPIKTDCSDSRSLDSMLDLLIAGGMDCLQAMRALIPPAWNSSVQIDHSLRQFYKLLMTRMEPWDGPAGIVFSDGRYAACCLDRNGLRPARWAIGTDNVITLASEYGVCQAAPDKIKTKGRLGPGQMLAIDTYTGKLFLNSDLNESFKSRVAKVTTSTSLNSRAIPFEHLKDAQEKQPFIENKSQLTQYEKQFQVSFEEIEQVISVLASVGMEAIGAMGDDTPLPIISQKRRSLYDNFRQFFAQVTNPPIDSLREGVVMSLETLIGEECDFFDLSQSSHRFNLLSPVLSRNRFSFISSLKNEHFNSKTLDLNIPLEQSLEEGVRQLCERAVGAVDAGCNILVLSDQNLSRERYPIHALVATGAVHHALTRAGLRCNGSIVVATGTARDPHHIAVLIGYGATAVYPYLAFDIINYLPTTRGGAKSVIDSLRNFRSGVNKGLLKIMSKIGISVLSSYRAAQLYEIVGLDDEVIELCFEGTPSRIGGLNFKDIEDDLRAYHQQTWDVLKTRPVGGLLKFIQGEEYHAFNPDVVQTLLNAVKTAEYGDYQEYARLVNHRRPTVLRDLWRLKKLDKALPLEEIEPIESILPRFDTAGMSLGALSPEAHETLAQAMNYIGGRSNSGEGGEDDFRYRTDKNSKIKQVASGRFGVTPHYLVNAEVLQIKIAQGAKPGEGGQLPGDKVNKMIATLRCSTPGFSLISPPPHHDIYSIEDLAQLIYDLKKINDHALVSVKLVALAGVGTIAVGVAKAYADLITIAGYDGGTGASPITSVKYAGSPWELGLPETHQMLCANNLRERIRLQVDGGLKTGLDVVKGAIMGAESFGFGTAPMIAMGCKYLRICHLNNCATGVATQVPVLRMKHFVGTAERVVNYFRFVASEARELMAAVGVRKLTDLIGRTDLLDVIESPDNNHQGKPDFSKVIFPNSDGAFSQYCHKNEILKPAEDSDLSERMISDCAHAIVHDAGGDFSYGITNRDRSIGAAVSGIIARKYGNRGLKNPINFKFIGVAGQSFACWNTTGMNLHLEGDANDYVGKGMHGGRIVLYHDHRSEIRGGEHTIAGNTCLYGATGGKLFASGSFGERFGVRNSGATAVVEGTGDHCCEYMTGGVVVILGNTGVNFGAGMTGGMAMVYDVDGKFTDYCNHELIDIHRIGSDHMGAYQMVLHTLLKDHIHFTDSRIAQEILDDFYNKIPLFWLVKPKAIDLSHLLEVLRMAA